MELYQFILLAILGVIAIIIGIAAIVIIPKKNQSDSEALSRFSRDIIAANQSSVKNMGEMIASSQSEKLGHME